MLRWVGGVFDPKGFDLNRLNRDWRPGRRRLVYSARQCAPHCDVHTTCGYRRASSTRRAIKAPKIYWGDTGIALHLAEADEPAGAHLEMADATHLRTFRQEYGKKSWPGLLLHTGNSLEWLAPDVLAAPWWKVL